MTPKRTKLIASSMSLFGRQFFGVNIVVVLGVAMNSCTQLTVGTLLSRDFVMK